MPTPTPTLRARLVHCVVRSGSDPQCYPIPCASLHKCAIVERAPAALDKPVGGSARAHKRVWLSEGPVLTQGPPHTHRSSLRILRRCGANTAARWCARTAFFRQDYGKPLRHKGIITDSQVLPPPLATRMHTPQPRCSCTHAPPGAHGSRCTWRLIAAAMTAHMRRVKRRLSRVSRCMYVVAHVPCALPAVQGSVRRP